MINVSRFIVLTVVMVIFWNQCKAGTPSQAIIAIRVGFQFGESQPNFTSKASGFLVSKDGIVVTAKHVLDVTIPPGAKLVVEGARKSKDATYHPLYVDDPVLTNVDITTLRFSPALGNDWPFLSISSADPFQGETIVAWGFPLNQERVGISGSISGVIGINATLLPMSAVALPGMSGGPVVDKGDGARKFLYTI